MTPVVTEEAQRLLRKKWCLTPFLINEVVKFDLYRSEGVSHYVLVYPEQRKAKVYQLIDGEYRKVADYCNETHHFEPSKCAMDFDFSRLWRRKAAP